MWQENQNQCLSPYLPPTHRVTKSTCVMHIVHLETDESGGIEEKCSGSCPNSLPSPHSSCHPTLAPAPLTVEGKVSKGGCKCIHAEHGTDGHIGYSLHSVLGGPKVQKS